MNFLNIVLLLIAASFNSVAQLLLKKGSVAIGPIFSGSDPFIIKLIKTIFNPIIFSAIFFLVVGMFVWIKILSRTELSRAYPIQVALAIIIT